MNGVPKESIITPIYESRSIKTYYHAGQVTTNIAHVNGFIIFAFHKQGPYTDLMSVNLSTGDMHSLTVGTGWKDGNFYDFTMNGLSGYGDTIAIYGCVGWGSGSSYVYSPTHSVVKLSSSGSMSHIGTYPYSSSGLRGYTISDMGFIESLGKWYAICDNPANSASLHSSSSLNKVVSSWSNVSFTRFGGSSDTYVLPKYTRLSNGTGIIYPSRTYVTSLYNSSIDLRKVTSNLGSISNVTRFGNSGGMTDKISTIYESDDGYVHVFSVCEFGGNGVFYRLQHYKLNLDLSSPTELLSRVFSRSSSYPTTRILPTENAVDAVYKINGKYYGFSKATSDVHKTPRVWCSDSVDNLVTECGENLCSLLVSDAHIASPLACAGGSVWTVSFAVENETLYIATVAHTSKYEMPNSSSGSPNPVGSIEEVLVNAIDLSKGFEVYSNRTESQFPNTLAFR